jgi:hypothetical protein
MSPAAPPAFSWDRHALPLPSGQLTRQLATKPRRQANSLEQFVDASLGPRDTAQDHRRTGDLIGDELSGVQ